jgi:ABC-type sugar transport system ATPase subunit
MSDHSTIAGPLDGPANMLETLLKIEHVSKEFPMNDGTTLTALRDFSLTVHNIEAKPQIVSLLGPSGAGKTTALRIIAALDRPTSGQVLITNGADQALRPVRVGDVGVVFQRYPLFDDLNVLNNLIEPAARPDWRGGEGEGVALPG